jgi:SAM-dependent methyltransferase
VNPPCALCGGECPLRFRKGAYAIHRCDRCDLEFVWPTPSPDAVKAVYERGYFSGDGPGYEDYFGRERDLAGRKAAARLDALAALGRTGGTMLDFGCAAGYFVESARAHGWDAYGVEPSPEAQRGWSEGARPYLAASLDALRHRGPFDVITAWDVLEHLADPIETLRALRALARPGAVFAVVVPVIGNVNTRLAPSTWDQYKPPEHLWFFSRASRRATLLAGAGARVVREDVAWARRSRFVDPEGRARALWTRAARAVESSLFRAASVVAPSLTVDSVAFYAVEEP